MSASIPATITEPSPGAVATNPIPRHLFWGGVALSLLCILAFLLQVFGANVLLTPWYLPVGGTIGALLVVGSLARRRAWWRVGAATGLIALACLEWLFLLNLTVLPAYSGPIATGSQVPTFRAMMADGAEFTDAYFDEHPMTALVFFQGRWCPFCMTQLKDLEAHHDDFAQADTEVVVVSLEDAETAAQTQRDFPHLTVVSDERRELSGAIDLINKAFAPDGSDCAAPTLLLVGQGGKVRWLHRPTRFIARPSAAELVATIKAQRSP